MSGCADRNLQQRGMKRAMVLAAQAAASGEVPVGAVVVAGGQIIGEGMNRNIASFDPAAHAEIMALRQAAERVGNHRLPGAMLMVTLEPCTMCVGALVHSRIEHLLFAAREPKTGAVVSCSRLLDAPWHNHRVSWSEGLMAEESAALLKKFFAARR